MERLRRLDPLRRAAVGALVVLLMLLLVLWAGARWHQRRLIAGLKRAAEIDLRRYEEALVTRLGLLRSVCSFIELRSEDPTFDDLLAGFARDLIVGYDATDVVVLTQREGGEAHVVAPHRLTVSGGSLSGADFGGTGAGTFAEDRGVFFAETKQRSDGSFALTVYKPVFVGSAETAPGRYWGVAGVVVDLSTLMMEVVEHEGFDVALRDSRGEVLYGAPQVFARDPVVSIVPGSGPSEGWALAISPSSGWKVAVRRPLARFLGAGFAISLLYAGLAFAILYREGSLAETISERTEALAAANQQLRDDIRLHRQMVGRVKESEARFRSVFEASGDGMIITRLDGRIADINPAACDMYGYAREEIVGRPLTRLIQVDYHTLFDEMLERVRHGESFVVDAEDRKRDGTTFHAEVYGSSLNYAGSLHLLSVVRDVTERVHSVQLLEQRVQERTRELSTLLKVSRDVASILQLESLLAQTLDRLGDVIAYDGAAIFSLQGQETLMLLDYRGPELSRDLPHRWDLSDAEHLRMVLDHRHPITIPDVHGETLQARAWQRSWGASLGRLAESSASWLGVPLQIKDRTIGIMTLEHREVGHFTPHHAQLALAFAHHVAVALENARLYEESQRLGMLEERQRIARELHDSVSQALYSIGLGARTARALVNRDPVAAIEPIEYVLSLAEAGLAEMRALILELRPDVLEREGLAASLTKYAEALSRRHGVDVKTELIAEPSLPSNVKEALYRVAYEALNNTIKHADAHRVDVELTASGGTVVLTVCDDGNGFNPQATYPGHFGLQSMRERVERLSGTLVIESQPGAGTCVRATVPAHRDA
jgi:PAS domain S-box-containing protein